MKNNEFNNKSIKELDKISREHNLSFSQDKNLNVRATFEKKKEAPELLSFDFKKIQNFDILQNIKLSDTIEIVIINENRAYVFNYDTDLILELETLEVFKIVMSEQMRKNTLESLKAKESISIDLSTKNAKVYTDLFY